MPAAYVEALFDDYAPRFDAALVEKLAYRTPALLAQALLRRAGGRRFARAIDLGCGTGLMGEVLRSRVDDLTGIDLSAQMVAVAGKKGIYDRLAAGDALAFLAAEPAGSADLIVAADVLPYVGNVRPLFAAAARVLAPVGVLALSAERADGNEIVLGPALRYRHPAAVLRQAAEATGLAVAAIGPAVLRKEAGRPVDGLIVVAERRA
jgi:predicted TPR repeat methyltransferase